MQVEPTITLGNLLNLLISLGTIFIAAWRIISRLSRMELKLNLLWHWFAKEHGFKEDTKEEE